MPLNFKLDNISPDGSGYVAYVEMRDDAGVIVARKCVPYSEDADSFQTAIADKFAAAIEKHTKKESVTIQAAAVISGITTDKIAEVSAKSKTIETTKE